MFKAELIIELMSHLLPLVQTNMFCLKIHWSLKDTHKVKTPANKTETYTKSMTMYIWAIVILNQLFIRDSYTQIRFSRKRKKRSS